MASLQKLIEAAAWDDFSLRAPHLDEYVRRWTEADEGMEAGDLWPAKDFVEYLKSFGDLFDDLLAATDRQLANPRAWPAKMPPRGQAVRPPILF